MTVLHFDFMEGSADWLSPDHVISRNIRSRGIRSRSRRILRIRRIRRNRSHGDDDDVAPEGNRAAVRQRIDAFLWQPAAEALHFASPGSKPSKQGQPTSSAPGSDQNVRIFNKRLSK